MAKISDIRNKTIYIYGAGYRGQYCYDIIKHTACVKAFLDSGNSCLENKGGGAGYSNRFICRKAYESKNRFYNYCS